MLLFRFFLIDSFACCIVFGYDAMLFGNCYGWIDVGCVF